MRDLQDTLPGYASNQSTQLRYRIVLHFFRNISGNRQSQHHNQLSSTINHAKQKFRVNLLLVLFIQKSWIEALLVSHGHGYEVFLIVVEPLIIVLLGLERSWERTRKPQPSSEGQQTSSEGCGTARSSCSSSCQPWPSSPTSGSPPWTCRRCWWLRWCIVMVLMLGFSGIRAETDLGLLYDPPDAPSLLQYYGYFLQPTEIQGDRQIYIILTDKRKIGR